MAGEEVVVEVEEHQLKGRCRENFYFAIHLLIFYIEFLIRHFVSSILELVSTNHPDLKQYPCHCVHVNH